MELYWLLAASLENYLSVELKKLAFHPFWIFKPKFCYPSLTFVTSKLKENDVNFLQEKRLATVNWIITEICSNPDTSMKIGLSCEFSTISFESIIIFTSITIMEVLCVIQLQDGWGRFITTPSSSGNIPRLELREPFPIFARKVT